MSPEKHFSDRWIQNERMLTNISSGTFWNYWHNPFRSTRNGFSIKTMWNGFTYSWNKSRKKRNSQSAVMCCLDVTCPVLSRTDSRTRPSEDRASRNPSTGGVQISRPIPHRGATAADGCWGGESLFIEGMAAGGSPRDSPIATHVWATLRKLPGSSETKPLGEEYWGAQRNWRWKQWVDKFLFQCIKFSKTNSNEKLLTDLMNFISSHPCWNTLKPANYKQLLRNSCFHFIIF